MSEVDRLKRLADEHNKDNEDMQKIRQDTASILTKCENAAKRGKYDTVVTVSLGQFTEETSYTKWYKEQLLFQLRELGFKNIGVDCDCTMDQYFGWDILTGYKFTLSWGNGEAK